MERADNVEIHHKVGIEFSKAITSQICSQYLTACFCTLTQEKINSATQMLWELDPCSVVVEGEFKGATSLLLYCSTPAILHLRAKKLNMNNLNKTITKIINHSNLDINATLIQEGRHKDKTVLWFAAQNEQWELAIKLIDRGADINATCGGEGPDKGKSVLWWVAYNENWELVDELIKRGTDINATCIGEDILAKGVSVLWIAAGHAQWELAIK